MIVFSWVLLGLAIAGLLFAIVQLFLLSEMRLIVYNMKPHVAWAVVVGPSALVLVVAIVALSLPHESHPHSAPAVLILGYVLLAIVGIFQGSATKPIMEKRYEWDADLEQRNRAVNHNSSR